MMTKVILIGGAGLAVKGFITLFGVLATTQTAVMALVQ